MNRNWILCKLVESCMTFYNYFLTINILYIRFRKLFSFFFFFQLYNNWMDIYKTTIFFVIYILPSFETCFLENYRTEIGKRLYTLAWINVNRLDFTSVSFSRPARPAACRRLTENTNRDPEERSEGRTEGRKESTIRVETQRGSPHLRLPSSATITKIIEDSRQTISISNRLESTLSFFLSFFLGGGGMPNIFDLPLRRIFIRAFVDRRR